MSSLQHCFMPGCPNIVNANEIFPGMAGRSVELPMLLIYKSSPAR
jgi:hypothetical protein